MDSNNQNEQVTKDLREQGIDQEEQGIGLSKDEIKDLIVKFNLDSSIEKLKEYYSTPTTWEIIGKSRSETCHTQFLAWFFGNSDFNANPNTGPIKKLIVLLLKWAKQQKGAQFNNDLANSIYSQSFKIIKYEVKAEEGISLKQTSQDKPAYGKGQIDIFINCTAKVNGNEKNINIVIENKINAPETTKKKQGITLYQTEAYKQYVEEVKGNDTDINLFVFLKPTSCKLEDIKEAECECKEYIQINYQELLDNIIQPVCEMKDISEENRFRLKDYIKTLGTPSETEDETEDTDDDTIDNSNKKITIMAMVPEEKKLLKKFFDENEDLIRAAVTALGIKELSEGLENYKNNKNYYTINDGQDRFSMYEVVEKFVEFRLNASVSVQDIDKEIRGYVNPNGTKRTIVSDDPDILVDKEDKKKEGSCGKIIVNNQEIRYTKQWGDSGTNKSFTKLRNGINKNHPDFQIVPIKKDE